MDCPKCDGRKYVVLDSNIVTVYTVDDEPYRIVSYRYTVSKSGESLRYKLKRGYFKEEWRKKSVREEEIFSTREEAIKVCEDMNWYAT